MPQRATGRTKLSKISCFFNFMGLFVTLMGLFITLLGVTQKFRLNLHIIGPIIMGSGSLVFFIGMLIWLHLRRSYRSEQTALRQVEEEFQRHVYTRNGHNPNCSFYREKAQSRNSSRNSTPSNLASRSPDVANHHRVHKLYDGDLHSPDQPQPLPDDCVWLTVIGSPQILKLDFNCNYYSPCIV